MKKLLVVLLSLVIILSFTMSALAELKKGSKGADVVELQKRLIELGFLDGDADGAFGKQTAAAVEAFQEMNGLDVTGVATIKDTNVMFSDTAIPKSGIVGTNPTNTEADTKSTTDSADDVVPYEPVLVGDDWEITKIYQFDNYGSYHYGIVFHHSKEIDQKTDVNFTFYDSDNNIIGVWDDYVGCTGHGFDYYADGLNDAPFDHVEVSFSFTDLKATTHCMDTLKIDTSRVNDKVIIVAENTGEKPVSSCEYDILFFNKHGEVINSGMGYLNIPDSEMQQGEKLNDQYDPYESFADYEFFYNACNFGN